MARATTKQDLLDNAKVNYEKLEKLICNMSEIELETPFDFTNDEKKNEAHWIRDKNLRDVYIHLYEWHQLILKWINNDMNRDQHPFLPAPYNWKTYGKLNIEFWQETSKYPLGRL